MGDQSGSEGEKQPAKRSCLRKQLRKTKMCQHFERGECKFGADCAFAHAESEIQHAPDLRKTRLCLAFAEGRCTVQDCSFAHGEAELRSTDLFFKKTLCIWNEKGKCRAGDKCRFAHGQAELRAPTVADGLPSIGSRGHPDACAPPCRNHGRKRGCKDGATCGRCHLCPFKPGAGGRGKRNRDSSDDSRAASPRKRRRGDESRLDQHGNSRPSWLRDDGAAAWSHWAALPGYAAAYGVPAAPSWGYPVPSGYGQPAPGASWAAGTAAYAAYPGI